MHRQIKKSSHTPEVEREESAPKVSGELSDTAKDVLSSFWKDVIFGGGRDAEEQFGLISGESGGHRRPDHELIELMEGQEMSLKKTEEDVATTVEHMRYFREIKDADSTSEHKENAVIEQKVEEILIELKQLAKTSKEMQVLFKQVTVEEKPVQAGKYHLNFFEWLASEIRNARVRVEEGRNWLAMFTSRKGERQYWNMYKKHGTMFGLSGERSVSTQTG